MAPIIGGEEWESGCVHSNGECARYRIEARLRERGHRRCQTAVVGLSSSFHCPATIIDVLPSLGVRSVSEACGRSSQCVIGPSGSSAACHPVAALDYAVQPGLNIHHCAASGAAAAVNTAGPVARSRIARPSRILTAVHRYRRLCPLPTLAKHRRRTTPPVIAWHCSGSPRTAHTAAQHPRRTPPDRRRSLLRSALPAHQPRCSRSGPAEKRAPCPPRWTRSTSGPSRGVHAQSPAPLVSAARAPRTTAATPTPRAPRASTAARRATASAARPTTTPAPRRTRTPP